MPTPPNETAFESLVRQVRALPIGPEGVAAVLGIFEQFTGRSVRFSKSRRLRANPPEHLRRSALRLSHGGAGLDHVARELREGFGLSATAARRYAVEAARTLRPKPRRTDGPGASLG